MLLTFNRLVKTLCNDDGVETGLEFFEKMRLKDIVSCNILIDGLCRERRGLNALEFSKKML